MLRTAGVIRQYASGGRRHNHLQRDELVDLAPGLLRAVLPAVTPSTKN